jgi:hypothetical protein
MTRIVSKRLGSLYRFGRADCWLKPGGAGSHARAEKGWNS